MLGNLPHLPVKPYMMNIIKISAYIPHNNLNVKHP